MQLLKRDRSGISEIVGALMLVLIVVIAASSFAIFLSQYQSNAQAQKLEDQKRSSEKIGIVSITPVMKPATNSWYSFNFTIASIYDGTSEIDHIAINDNSVMQYTVWRTDPYTGNLEEEEMTTLDKLTLAPREQVCLTVEVSNPDALYEPVSIGLNDYVKIDLTTAWGNTFSKTFEPPSSVMSAPSQGSWLNNGTYHYYLTLNGQKSVAYDGAYIVNWNWTVTSTGLNDPANETVTTYLSGPVCNYYLPFEKEPTEHWVNLTVTDNFGMVGRSSFPLYYS